METGTWIIAGALIFLLEPAGLLVLSLGLLHKLLNPWRQSLHRLATEALFILYQY